LVFAQAKIEKKTKPPLILGALPPIVIFDECSPQLFKPHWLRRQLRTRAGRGDKA
jgi:hypothetical protein